MAQDKAKIEAVIAECGVKKIEALQKTWAKVNKDFGSIFSTLLPGEPRDAAELLVFRAFILLSHRTTLCALTCIHISRLL